jgi:SAM-dependent methyltransferase
MSEFADGRYGTVNPVHENGLDYYAMGLGLYGRQPVEWAGYGHEDELLRSMLSGRVLDLGSGATEKFGRELALAKQALMDGAQNIGHIMLSHLGREHAGIFSLNPDFSHEKIGAGLRYTATHELEGNRSPVAGIGEALPYRDGSFSGVFSVSALTVYAGPEKSKHAAKWVHEVARVLEPGGLAFFGPILPDLPENRGKKVLKSYKRLLESESRSGDFSFLIYQPRYTQDGLEQDMHAMSSGNVWNIAIKKAK